MWYQNIRSALFSFVTIHASDGRTDRRTELQQQYRALHYMQSHGKNQNWWVKPVWQSAKLKQDWLVITMTINFLTHYAKPILLSPCLFHRYDQLFRIILHHLQPYHHPSFPPSFIPDLKPISPTNQSHHRNLPESWLAGWLSWTFVPFSRFLCTSVVLFLFVNALRLVVCSRLSWWLPISF